MKDPSIIWRRTFPDCAPGTDGVAIFEGRVIGRVQHMTNLPRDPSHGCGASPTRISPAAGLGRQTHGGNALAPAGHGPLNRTLAGA